MIATIGLRDDTWIDWNGSVLTQAAKVREQIRSQITCWKDFLAAHMNVLAGCDFSTVEVLSWRGLVTYFSSFFWKAVA